MERALLLQELAHPPEEAADDAANACCGAGRECRCGRHRRRLARVFKIESHNHPTFIEPFQGAATGVGGILRDIFTMGARPIALLNSLRFGRSTTRPERATRRIVEGVVSGIADYGNCFGVATVGGEIAFEDATPATRSSTSLPRDCEGRRAREGQAARASAIPSTTSAPRPAATASTARRWRRRSSTRRSAEKRPAVQVGDPFMEKLLLEACLELMETDALIGIQDMGAAGLTCSTCEMGARGGSRHRDRRQARAAARDRHDAVRDHAVRVAGTHAARRQEGARGGSRSDLRQVGPARRRTSA